MKRTRTLAVFVALLMVGAVAAQVAAVPGVTAQEASPSEEGTTGVTVDSLAAPDSAAPNSTVDVAAQVTNNGDNATTETVKFRVGGAVVDSTSVALGPGENQTVHLTADTTGLDAGTYHHGVFTSSDGMVGHINISESFVLESSDAPENVTVGENLTVDATVSNPNDSNATQKVGYRLGGTPVASEMVTLGANESTDVTFNVSTEDIEPGDYNTGLFTRDDGTFAHLTVEEQPEEPTEEPTDEEPTEEPTDEEPTEEPTDEEPTEEPTDEEPTDEEPTEEPTDEEPTEEPTDEEPTEEPTDEEPTEEPTDEEDTEG